MKFLLTAILLVVSAFGALAQTPIYAPQTVAIPNIAEGGVSNSLALVIDCRKQQNVTLQIKCPLVTNQVFRIAASVDGLTYDTNHWVIGVAGAANTATLTNLVTLGFGFLRVDSVTNPGPGTSTNTFKYGVKIQAP